MTKHKRPFNVKFCDAAKPAEGQRQTDWIDADCKGLVLRVSPTAKTWCFMFTLSGKFCRMMLGTYPELSLAKARLRADEARAELAESKDPRTIATAPETLRSIGEEWWKREGVYLRTGEDRKAVLERAIYPTFGDRQLRDLRRSEIVRLLDRLTDEVGPSDAKALIGRHLWPVTFAWTY